MPEDRTDMAPETEQRSAPAPAQAGAEGAGEVAFADAEAPAAGEQPAAGDGAAPAGDASAPGAAPAGGGEAAVEHDLDELLRRSSERDEYLALAQRTQADFENYRRRMARENAQAAERGVTKVARELLPALDHLELALRSAAAQAPEDAPAGQADVVKGFAMVRDELAAALGRVGIEAFSPTGEPFDPTEHEAMAQVPTEGAETGTVVEVYQQGYRINGAVLRPARVVVAQ